MSTRNRNRSFTGESGMNSDIEQGTEQARRSFVRMPERNIAREQERISNEVKFMGALGFMIFLIMCNHHMCLKLGDLIYMFLHGFFGCVAYALPYVLFLAYIFMIPNRRDPFARSKTMSVTILMVEICCFIHLLTMNENSEFSLVYYFTAGQSGINGGLLGGLLAGGLQHLIGTVATMVILVLCMIATVIKLTETSAEHTAESVFAVAAGSVKGACAYVSGLFSTQKKDEQEKPQEPEAPAPQKAEKQEKRKEKNKENNKENKKYDKDFFLSYFGLKKAEKEDKESKESETKEEKKTEKTEKAQNAEPEAEFHERPAWIEERRQKERAARLAGIGRSFDTDPEKEPEKLRTVSGKGEYILYGDWERKDRQKAYDYKNTGGQGSTGSFFTGSNPQSGDGAEGALPSFMRTNENGNTSEGGNPKEPQKADADKASFKDRLRSQEYSLGGLTGRIARNPEASATKSDPDDVPLFKRNKENGGESEEKTSLFGIPYRRTYTQAAEGRKPVFPVNFRGNAGKPAEKKEVFAPEQADKTAENLNPAASVKKKVILERSALSLDAMGFTGLSDDDSTFADAKKGTSIDDFILFNGSRLMQTSKGGVFKEVAYKDEKEKTSFPRDSFRESEEKSLFHMNVPEKKSDENSLAGEKAEPFLKKETVPADIFGEDYKTPLNSGSIYDDSFRNGANRDGDRYNDEDDFYGEGSFVHKEDDDFYNGSAYGDEDGKEQAVFRNPYREKAESRQEEKNRDYFGGQGYDEEGFDQEGFNQGGFNQEGFNQEDFDQKDFNREGFYPQGPKQEGFHEEDFDEDLFGSSSQSFHLFDEQDENRGSFDGSYDLTKDVSLPDTSEEGDDDRSEPFMMPQRRPVMKPPVKETSYGNGSARSDSSMGSIWADHSNEDGRGSSGAVRFTQNMQTPVRQPEKEEVKPYVAPSPNCLTKGIGFTNEITENHIEKQHKLLETIKSFGVDVEMGTISPGPAVTRYELIPKAGVKVSRIVSLQDDIKLALAAPDIRIEAPIPGKSAIGIEVPNDESTIVGFRDLIEADAFRNSKSNLAFAVGRDLSGKIVVTDLAKMPHLLIAGATGSGKSVCINTIIMSILYKATPEKVKLIMIDPKVVELSVYNGIPHLLVPVVTDPKKASNALKWAVDEMDDRYRKFSEYNVRNLEGYNEAIRRNKTIDPDSEEEYMYQMVIIVDELADLMMVAAGEVEESICRLAQKARAAGIHLVLATQRPSVNVITGLIKANVPSRIAFAVSSGVDSRTIIDMNGAEKLLGKGDMLFYPYGLPKPTRVQGAFISDEEVTRVVDYVIRNNNGPSGHDKMQEMITSAQESSPAVSDRDELFRDVGMFVIEKDKGSIGALQRNFRIGFNRAARIMDQLAAAGVVGPEEGTKPRKILMTVDEFNALLAND